MLKNILIGLALVLGALGAWMGFTGGNFAGITHLSGLQIGADGLSFANGGGITMTAGSATSVSTFTQGGGVTATSSAASATILASSLDVENALEVSLPVGAVTLTLPASTTFPIGTTPGAFREFTMFNASTTAGAIITIAGNTGTLLEIASSTSAGPGLKTVAPAGVAVFTAWRKANSDIEVFMNPGQ